MWPCDRQTPRRVALSLFQVADSRQSLSAQNPPPSPPLNGKRNKLQSCFTQSSISLFSPPLFVCSFLSLSSFLVHFLYVISYHLVHKLRDHFPCWYSTRLFLCYSSFTCFRLSLLHVVDQGTKDLTRKGSDQCNQSDRLLFHCTLHYVR